MRRFLAQQPGHIQLDYQQLKQAIIKEFSDPESEHGLNTNADVIIISESWLNKTILDKEISITGYNVFRADRPKRGGGGRNLR